MNVRRLALAVALSLVPFAAAAADLPVSYLVEEKPLKAAVAGTPLTFELYSDNTCTTLVQSVPVAVEDVSLITKLKQLTPKNDTKLPNTVEMRTTLAGTNASDSYYLKVTGTGVVPVSGACQAQASSRPLRPMAVDSSGAIVGPAFGDAASGNVEAFLSSGNNVVGEQLNDSLISGNCGPTILFPPNDGIVAHVSADCTGTPYLVYRFLRHLGPVTYAVTGPAVSLMYNSVRDNSTIGCPCVTLTGGPTDLFPSVAVDTSGFTPPFRIELR